jgi:hypothetical protein
MNKRYRKFLISHVFDKKEANVYIVSIDVHNDIKDIQKATDYEAIQTGSISKQLHYYEIKRWRSNDGVIHYFYRSVNKMLENFDYMCL